MIKDYILKIEFYKDYTYNVYFDPLKPIPYYVYKNKCNYYEFCELDKQGRFINRNNTDFTLSQKEFLQLLREG